MQPRLRRDLGTGIALLGIIFAFLVGGLFGATAGWLFAIVAICGGIWLTYSKPKS